MEIVKKELEDTLLSLGIPLADYGLVDKKGIIFKSSFRNPNIFNPSNHQNNIFRMASMTKIVTAFLTLSVLKEKKINLNNPVAAYLPELKNAKIANVKGSSIKFTETKVPITFHQLLNCTSGHGYEHHHKTISSLVTEKKLSPMKNGDDQFLKAPLISTPGETWNYGISYGWLGKAIERITMMSLNENLKKYITHPLNLKKTTFDYKEVESNKLAPVFFRDTSKNYLDITEKVNLGKGSFSYGGGGLFSDLEDYLKFLALFLKNNQEKSALKPTTQIIDKIFSNQIGDLSISSLKSYNKTLALDYDLYSHIRKKWGYGLLINIDSLEGRRSQGSGSWAGVLNTFFWIDKKKGVAGVILMQALPCYDLSALKAFEVFEKLSYKLVIRS